MKVCLIYNFAQHYRTNIFTLIDRNLDIDFYFGDHYLNVKKMDYSLLTNKVKEVKNLHFGPIGWQTDIITLPSKGYEAYIMLGEPMCLSTWIMLILSRINKKKVFLWTHGWYGKETRIKAIIKKVFFGLADGCLLYGNYARELMIKEGLAEDKLHVIHNSLMYDKQIEKRKALTENTIYQDHFKNSLPNVVFIGRLTRVKNLVLVLEALAYCKERGKDFNVSFIGDGEEKEILQQRARQLDVEGQTWFYGPSYDEDEISILLYNADLCVAPGNIGLTAMHAMSYGCPCISHNNFPYQMPEFEAIKEGETGSFFNYNDSKSLGDCIASWLETHTEDRDKIREACYKEIDENWNPHVQLELIKKILNE